jgi:hypothetical protein
MFRRPRGHFTAPSLWELFEVLALLLGAPALSIGALIVLSVLKIWFSFSWWWLLIPALALIAWAVVVRIWEM